MAISSRNPQFRHPTDLRTVILLRPLGQRYFSPLLCPDKRRDSTLTLFANSGFPSLSIKFFWWDSNPRTLNIFRPPLNRGLHCLALYRLSYRRLIPCGTDSMIFIRSAKTLVFSSAGFEPARSESKSEESCKCRALS